MEIRFVMAFVVMLFGTPASAGAAEDIARFFVPIPDGWVVAFERANAESKGTELIPTNQNIDDWSDLIAVLVKDRQVLDTPADYFTFVMDNMRSTCRSVTYRVLSKAIEVQPGVAIPDPDLSSATFLTFCHWSDFQFTETQNPAPHGEIGAYYVIAGVDRLFIVKRAWRTAPFEDQQPPISVEELDAEVTRVTAAALCDNGTDETCAATVAETLLPFIKAGDSFFKVDSRFPQ